MSERRNQSPLARGLRVGRPFGIQVIAHWSLVVIFGLITLSLGGSVFPAWHQDWSPVTTWLVAAASAFFFFVSIAVHELAHALMGRGQGMRVARITLFVFGGLAQTEDEAPSPKAELLVAAIGPLVSLVIGVAASAVGATLAAAGHPQGTSARELITSAGPVATLLLWLGPINVVLAVFNMVPGFPLDGGRVLRAILWWSTGDLEKATRWAAGAGQAFAWGLIGLGALMLLGVSVPWFGRGLAGGLWLIVIGWFLNNAARMSYAQVVIRDALTDVPVRAMMRSRIASVAPDVPLDRLVGDYIMSYDQRTFPVVDDGRLLGMVDLESVRHVPHGDWPSVTVRQIMTSLEDSSIMSPDEPALEALDRLSRTGVDQISVIDHGELRGVVRQRDITRWLTLQDRHV